MSMHSSVFARQICSENLIFHSGVEELKKNVKQDGEHWLGEDALIQKIDAQTLNPFKMNASYSFCALTRLSSIQ